MAGCGMRGARYLLQADADEVWVNDGSQALHEAMVFNMGTAARLPGMDLLHLHGQRKSLLSPREVKAEPSPDAAAHTATAAAASEAGPGEAAGSAGHLEEVRRVVETRQRVAEWEVTAQRVRLEGLARDVWQWELPPRELPAEAAAAATPSGHRSVATSNSVSPSTIVGHACNSPASGEGGGNGLDVQSAAGIGDVDASCSSGRRGSQHGVSTSGCSVTPGASSIRRIRISHADANRLLTSCYVREDYYDLIDIDSFGSDTMHFPAAVDAVRFGGLLYLTSTDGFTASGKRPERGLAAYGSYLRALPWANEQGLRMLVGAAVREAASRGVALTPVFSLYSYHGPVFRVMLRARRTAEWPAGHYGFAGHCFVHGDNYTVGWRGLGAAVCRCESRGKRVTRAAAPQSAPRSVSPQGGSAPRATGDHDATATISSGGGSDGDLGGASRQAAATPLVLSGPLWTGPLHDADELRAMAEEAAARGWTGFGMDPESAPHLHDRAKSSRNVRPLPELMEVLREEADPRLPPGFFHLDGAVARRLARAPPRDDLLAALREEGFAAARCHLEARAFRTNACMEDILRVAEQGLGIPRRR